MDICKTTKIGALNISLSREHAQHATEIEGCFEGIESSVDASYTRLFEGELPMQILIFLGGAAVGGAFWDVLKLGINKIFSKFKNARINVHDKQSIPFVVLPDGRVRAVVVPEREKEFSHIKNIDDLMQHLAGTPPSPKQTQSQNRWKTVKLGDLFKVKHGYAFPGKNITTGETDKILVTPGNFKIGGGFNGSKFKYFDSDDFPEEYILKENDLIVTMTDLSKAGDTLGYSALVPNIPGKKLLHNQRIGLITDISEGADKEFLYWLLRSRKYRHSVLGSATGTTVRHTSPSRIYNVELEIPESLQEQKRIAHILSTFDKKIELLQKQNKTLEAIAQTLYKRWFVDFEFPNEDGKPYKSSGGKMVPSELGEIPEGWEVGKLKDFGNIICGKTPSKAKSEFFGGEVPFVKIPDMHNQLFIIDTEDKLTEEGANHQKNKFIPKNSICVSCIATVGLVSITSRESQTNQQINSIVLNSELCLEYLYFTLKFMKKDLLALGSGGSATLNINTNTFSNIKILLPSTEVLKAFHQRGKQVFEKISHNLNYIQTLKKTSRITLSKLIH